MKIVMAGDVVGRDGRNAVIRQLPVLRQEMGIDFAVVNADNAAGGFGTTPRHNRELLDAGADALTCGDHVWDQEELRPSLDQDLRLLRPHNYPSGTPGTGVRVFDLPGGARIVLIHLLGQVFIRDHVNCPFACVEQELERWVLGRNADAIVVDFHAEATSEKMAMGVALDGRVSAVVGTHTHVATADAMILPGGTAYQTDLGMCGAICGGVIGFNPEVPLKSFRTKMRRAGRMTPLRGEEVFSGAVITIEEGKAVAIEPVRRTGQGRN